MDKAVEVLAKLREERARLAGELAGVDRAIAALEAATEPKPPVVPPRLPEPPPPPPVFEPPPPPPPPGPYAFLEFCDAVNRYLHEAGEPRTVRQIAEGLLERGYKTTSSNFPSVVRTMLQRHQGLGVLEAEQTRDGSRWYVTTPSSDASS